MAWTGEGEAPLPPGASHSYRWVQVQNPCWGLVAGCIPLTFSSSTDIVLLNKQVTGAFWEPMQQQELQEGRNHHHWEEERPVRGLRGKKIFPRGRRNPGRNACKTGVETYSFCPGLQEGSRANILNEKMGMSLQWGLTVRASYVERNEWDWNGTKAKYCFSRPNIQLCQSFLTCPPYSPYNLITNHEMFCFEKWHKLNIAFGLVTWAAPDPGPLYLCLGFDLDRQATYTHHAILAALPISSIILNGNGSYLSNILFMVPISETFYSFVFHIFYSTELAAETILFHIADGAYYESKGWQMLSLSPFPQFTFWQQLN